jgi:hypothetical protein
MIGSTIKTSISGRLIETAVGSSIKATFYVIRPIIIKVLLIFNIILDCISPLEKL